MSKAKIVRRKAKPPAPVQPQTISGIELRALKKDLARTTAACRASFNLLREMEREGALRLPFPGYVETFGALMLVLGLK